MSYMEKKTSKRQTTIISLSDQNQKQIQDIRDEKKQMIDEYEEKKAGEKYKIQRHEMWNHNLWCLCVDKVIWSTVAALMICQTVDDVNTGCIMY